MSLWRNPSASQRLRDHGAADALGLVVLAAPMVAFAVLVFFLGQGIDLNAQLRSAAEAAAQAAALERDAASADAAARVAATRMLDDTVCKNPGVVVTYPTFGAGAGVDVLVVEALVSCDESRDGFEAVGVESDDVQRSARAAATIDFFRSDDRRP